MPNEQISVTVRREDKYRFLVDFEPGMPELTADEPPPLVLAAGPSPSHLLAAAVANCLSASLIFAFGKFKEDPGAITTTATCDIGRNERNRLRVMGIDVRLTCGATPQDPNHLARILAQFEDFCTVSQSVQSGIPLTLHVLGPDGQTLK
jgi:organic hydroperoxide reductase OsmC/OhrA